MNLLTLQSKLIASGEKADIVLSTHVDEAFNMIISKKKRGWWKDFSKIVGSALFGAFIPGLIFSLSKGDMTMMLIFVTIGFMGIYLIFLGIIWEYKK